MELFPIWNVADMAIVLGVVGVLAFHHIFHEHLEQQMNRTGDIGPAASPTDSDTSDDEDASLPSPMASLTPSPESAPDDATPSRAPNDASSDAPSRNGAG